MAADFSHPHAAHMRLLAFGPDDAEELTSWADLVNAVSAADAPWSPPETPSSAEGYFRHGWDGEPDSPYLALDGDRVVGWGAVAASDYDNLDLAWLHVAVHPAHRRRGLGSAILAGLLEEAVRRGRTSVGVDAWESEAADGFAARHGFERKHSAINRRQVLADVDWAGLEKQYDEALPHAADYVLERWPFPTPDERLEELAVMAASINDAPLGDLDYEDEVFTGERMRAYEVARSGRGQRMYRMMAIHRPSGELTAQTVVAVSGEDPTWADQHDTSVVRSHRGHRLGLLLKTEMLRWLAEAEPRLQTIDTWNAESNQHMIGVNEVLGYRVLGRELAYQRSLRPAGSTQE